MIQDFFAVLTETKFFCMTPMTAAKVLDVTSRLQDCASEGSDAVSAHTQVKIEDAPKLLRYRCECPVIWIRLPLSRSRKSWDTLTDLVEPLERNLYGQPLARLFVETRRSSVRKKDGKENQDGNAYKCIESVSLSTSWPNYCQF